MWLAIEIEDFPSWHEWQQGCFELIQKNLMSLGAWPAAQLMLREKESSWPGPRLVLRPCSPCACVHARSLGVSHADLTSRHVCSIALLRVRQARRLGGQVGH